ncbi:hypothetical protein D3C87_678800 [compost metagenome]
MGLPRKGIGHNGTLRLLASSFFQENEALVSFQQHLSKPQPNTEDASRYHGSD